MSVDLALSLMLKDIQKKDALVAELVGALEDELDDLNTDIRWADGRALESLIERRVKLESALTKAREQMK